MPYANLDTTKKGVLDILITHNQPMEKWDLVAWLSFNLVPPSILAPETPRIKSSRVKPEDKRVVNPYHCTREMAKKAIQELVEDGCIQIHKLSPENFMAEITARGRERYAEISGVETALQSTGITTGTQATHLGTTVHKNSPLRDAPDMHLLAGEIIEYANDAATNKDKGA